MSWMPHSRTITAGTITAKQLAISAMFLGATQRRTLTASNTKQQHE